MRFIQRNEPSSAQWCTFLSIAINKLTVSKCTVKTNDKIYKQPDDMDI